MTEREGEGTGYLFLFNDKQRKIRKDKLREMRKKEKRERIEKSGKN